MNSAELFKDNKKGLAKVYNAIFELLKPIAEAKNITLTAKEPVLDIKPTGSLVNILAMLRFGGHKNPSLFTLGYSNADFTQKLATLFPPSAEPNPAVKSPEFEVMKALYPVLDAEFKTQGAVIDPKTAMIQDGASIGAWKQMAVEQSVLFPIGTPSGDLVFEMPLFDVNFAREMTYELYGFKDTARIMVVDDSLVSRKTSRTYLAMAGYFNLDETADGQQAFNKIYGSTPTYDLVVADWHMPVMSGFEMLKKIRSVPEFKKMPVILVTGEKNKEEIVNAIKEGVTGYLMKPVAVEDFFKTLKKAAGKI